jgi:hypothetical protein
MPRATRASAVAPPLESTSSQLPRSREQPKRVAQGKARARGGTALAAAEPETSAACHREARAPAWTRPASFGADALRVSASTNTLEPECLIDGIAI